MLIGLGGGSPIDAAKAISYFTQQETGGVFVPQVAIPTTLSAAEFTTFVVRYTSYLFWPVLPNENHRSSRNAGYTSEEGHKTSVAHPQLGPKVIQLFETSRRMTY